MKKFIIIIVCAICAFCSCTANQMAKSYGGKMTINLDAGEKLVEATWKEDELWYLTEPMEDDYIPKTKTFKEKSSFGIVEGTVIFIEKR